MVLPRLPSGVERNQRSAPSWDCRIANVGDRLYVRETHFDARDHNERRVLYAVTGDTSRIGRTPSIHMPKEFARIWPDINAVRVERRQNISEEQARAEGIEPIRRDDGEGEVNWRDYQRAGDELTDPSASFG